MTVIRHKMLGNDRFAVVFTYVKHGAFTAAVHVYGVDPETGKTQLHVNELWSDEQLALQAFEDIV